MNRLNRPVSLTIILSFLFAATAAARDVDQYPNIVVILADDLGYGSVNSYGASQDHIRTPNIDRLAKEGRRFTDANTPSSVCSPTRYGLLTGRYCWRTSLRHGVLGTKSPLHIEITRPTIAALLQSVGYRTAGIGKWHLGYGTGQTDYTKPLDPGPLDIGFDYHFGVPQNHGDATGIYVRNRKTVGLRSNHVKPYGKTPYGRPRRPLPRQPQGHGLVAATSWKSAGNTQRLPARDIATRRSSSTWRRDSRPRRSNSDSSSRNSTPWCARETSPGSGGLRPPSRPAVLAVW